MLIAEIFLLGKFFSGKFGKLGRLSTTLLFASMALLLVSMFFGYMTYGAAVELVRKASLHDDTQSHNDVQQSFEDAGVSALAQFVSFSVGLLAFILLFAINAKVIGAAINDAKSG